VRSHRVAITGLGAVTPLGRDTSSTWGALLQGQSAVRIVPWLAEAGARVPIAAEVQDFDAERLDSRQPVDRLSRTVQFGLAAGIEAWHDAKLDPSLLDVERCGVVLGTGFGGAAETFHETEHYLRGGARAVRPTYVVRGMASATAAHLGLEFGLKGPTVTTTSACAAGSHAIAMGARLVQSGDVDIVLVGGAEQIGCVLASVAFDALRALSSRNDEPARASRPFDRDRDGFVLGEGAGVLVLERWDLAARRGARIYAELAGIGMTNEAHHLTAPDPSGAGAARAMALALADAELAPHDVGYVNAHGTSTRLNDAMETRALHRVFGTHAAKIAVSSTKSMIGHLIGASGAVALIATVLTLRDGITHPTINYETADPDCDLDYVPNRARPTGATAALANAFAFGGPCVSIAVRRP
jgi:3-oxoacyl-[acyl-carrier-protein] synthase II